MLRVIILSAVMLSVAAPGCMRQNDHEMSDQVVVVVERVGDAVVVHPIRLVGSESGGPAIRRTAGGVGSGQVITGWAPVFS
jgi:hypothetical protein